MTAAQIKALAEQRVGEVEGSPAYWTQAEFLAGVNFAQRLFVLLTLCLEKTEDFTLLAGKCFYRMRGWKPDFLVPLKLTASGSKLLPARIDDLDALDSGWQASPGSPTRYTAQGFGLFAVYRQPITDTAARLTYCYEPPVLTSDASEPVIPIDYHHALASGAVAYLRAKEGGNALRGAVEYFQHFMGEAQRLGDYMRDRMIAGRYDRLPLELQHLDLSALLKTTKEPK